MFDVSLHIAQSECNKTEFYTEINTNIVADGMGHYIIDNIKMPSELEEFLAWVNEVDDMRTTLWEGGPWSGPEWENRCLDFHAE